MRLTRRPPTPPVERPTIPGFALQRPLTDDGEADGPPWLALDLTTRRRVVVRAAAGALTAEDLPKSRHLHGAVTVGDGGAWTAASYVDHGGFGRWLGDRRLPPGELVTVGIGAARGLAELHARGLSHGRVSATNLLIDGDGHVLVDASEVLPASATSRQRAGDIADLGQLLLAHAEQPLPERLAAVLARAAQNRPGDDALSAAELVEALTQACPSRPLAVPRVPTGPALPRPVAAWWRGLLRDRVTAALPLALGIAGALVLAVGLGLLWSRLADPPLGVASSRQPQVGATPQSSDRPVLPPGNRWDGIVLGLDQARVHAFELADPAGLGAVDAPGSAALARDGEAVAALVNQDLRPTGQAFTVLKVQVQGSSSDRVVLTLTDRASSYQLFHTDGRLAATQPARGPARWRVELAWTAGRWLFADVTPLT